MTNPKGQSKVAAGRAPGAWQQVRDLPGAVHLLCLGTLVNRAGSFLLPFLTYYLCDTLNLSIAVATTAMGAYGLGAVVASLAGGHLADVIGRRVTMIVALVGGAVMLVGFAELRSPFAVVAATFGFSLLSEMGRPASLAMIADLVEPARRPQAYALMYVAVNLGFTLGAAVGGVVASYSFQWLLRGDALTSCIFAVMLLVLIRETLPSRASRPTRAGRRHHAAPSAERHGRLLFAAAATHVLRDRVFLLYCGGRLLIAIVFTQLISCFPLQLREHGLGQDTYGAIIAVNGAMIVALQLPVSASIIRLDRGSVVAAAAALTALGFGLIGLASVTWQFVLIVIVITAGEIMQAPLGQAIVGDLAPEALRGRYLGVLSLCSPAAMVVGAPLGGWLLAHAGCSVMWGGCLVVGALAAVIFLAIRRQVAMAPAL